MSTNLRIVTLAIGLLATAALAACKKDEHAGHDHKPGEGHDHAAEARAGAKPDHKHKAMPKGGRLLEKTGPHAEFVVEPDRSVTINFYTEDMKPVAATTQTVTVIADAKEGGAKLEFAKKGDFLASQTKLPAGDGYNLVVQFRQTAEATPQNLRFKLDLAVCGECKLAEYACTCDH